MFALPARRLLSRGFLFFSVLALGACASTPALVVPPDVTRAHELPDVPFIPQADYQCGPAALATMLRSSGVEVTADELIPRVYLPERKGSLATELVAATRQYERLAYVVDRDVSNVIASAAANHPVLVLQNLGLKRWPVWHFAVVVGYDLERGQFILRSGTERRHAMSLRSFVRTWERAGRWGLLVLNPDTIPTTATPEQYVRAAAGLEAVGKLDSARRAYNSARSRWPESAWPWLGLANVAYLSKDRSAARDLYREALVRDPHNVSAHYNVAELLGDEGCAGSARTHLEQALSLTTDESTRQRIQARLRELAGQGNTSSDRCS